MDWRERENSQRKISVGGQEPVEAVALARVAVKKYNEDKIGGHCD